MSQPPINPGPPPPYDPPEPPYSTLGTPMRVAPSPRRRATPWIAGAAASLVSLFVGIGIGATAGSDEQPIRPAAAGAPTATTTTAAPKPTTAAPTPAKTTAAPKPPKVVYAALSERQWKLVAKNPDNYVGKTYTVYGVVTQFDAATGANSFLANVSGKNLVEDYDYETNTMLSGDAGKLQNLVEDDEFRATVRVVGSHSYDTQIGGNTTVPLLAIASIKVI